MKWHLVIICLSCVYETIYEQLDLGLHIAQTQGVLFGTDTIGTRSKFLWTPAKGALRAGYIDGSVWNFANLAYYSTAFRPQATNTGSTAIGWFNTAGGTYATALGASRVAASFASTVIGINNLPGGDPITLLDPLFQIGNGIPPIYRSNTPTILINGQMYPSWNGYLIE